jgi:uncharacterized peroxidase-related enzyme
MARLRTSEPAETSERGRELLDQVRQALGVVPNMTKVMVSSPAVLAGYLGLSGALGGGSLPVELRERIALATAEANRCSYCLSAHSYLAANVANIADEEIAASREFKSGSARADAALRFVRVLLATNGHVADDELAELRSAGFDDGEIAEVVANVALNVFTNLFNSVARTDVDFPVVVPLAG